jgi:ArsR family transcriptional regulator
MQATWSIEDPETTSLTNQETLMYENRMVIAAAKGAEKATRLFHALSDETRVRILQHLQSGEQCVCDLTDAFQTSQSRLSFHLKVLKAAGLVNDRPEGRWMYYSLNSPVLEELEDFIGELKWAKGATRSRCS